MVWSLARRELRGGARSFRVFFLCLLLGVFAIASVGAVRSAFVRGMDGQSRELMGGDISIELTHRSMSEKEAAFVEARGTTSTIATLRSMAHPDILANEETQTPGHSQLIEVKGVDGAYPLYGAAVLTSGGTLEDALALGDGTYGVVVEKSLLGRMNLEVGQTFRIGTLQVRIADTLAFEPDRVAGGFRFGPRVMMSRAGLDATGLIRPGSLITWRTRVALPVQASGLVDMETFKEEALEAFPDGGWKIQDRRRSAPGVRFFMDRVAMFLTMIGLAALVVGGVGVSNAVSAWLASRRETIATLKCLGADGKTIFAVYLVQVLVMATGAILAGLVFGTLTPFVLASLLADKLPIPVEFGFYPAAMFNAAAFGFLVTLIFSLWPLGQARGLSPAKLFRGQIESANPGPLSERLPGRGILVAILGALGLLVALAIFTSGYPPFSAIFLAGTGASMGGLLLAGLGAKRLARALPRISHAGVRLAIANLHRPGAATLSVVLSMGLGLTLLVIVVLVDGNLDHQIKEQIPKGAPGFFFVDIQKDEVGGFKSLIADNAGVHDLQLIPNLRGSIFSLNGHEPDLEAIDPDTRWVVRGDRSLTYANALPSGSVISEGTWWADDYDGPPLVSVEADAARGLGLSVGDTVGITILGRRVVAEVASLRTLEWRQIAFNYVFVYPPSVLSAAPHTWIGNLTLASEDEERVYGAISKTFPGVTTVRVKEALASINDLLGDLVAGIRVTSAVTIAAGVLVLAGALAAGHRRRIYDAVVLKVLGARRGFIARAFALEFALLGLLTACIAAGLGTLAAWLIITQAMETPWIFLPGRMTLTIVGAVSATLILGMIGTLATLKARPAQHLRNE